MERICPFLALADDGRTAVVGFDPAHRCRAVDPPAPLDRGQQLTTCLQEAYRACERHAAATQAAGDPLVPRPAADASFVATRLVLLNRLGHRRTFRAGPGMRRWALGGAMATIGVAAVASGVAGGLAPLVDGAPEDGARSTGTVSATPTQPAVGGPTLQPTAMTPSPEPPAPSAAASGRETYVVQPGDTLTSIAQRFGTTVAALQEANALGASDVIVVGQTLIVP